MENQTAQLLEKLANKLGTTSEYLFSVMVKQAPIEATILLFQYIAIIIFGIILFRLRNKFSKQYKDGNFTTSLYEENAELTVMPMIIGVTIFIIFN